MLAFSEVAAVAAPASRDFLGSFDLERLGRLVVVARTAGLARAALVVDHWRVQER